MLCLSLIFVIGIHYFLWKCSKLMEAMAHWRRHVQRTKVCKSKTIRNCKKYCAVSAPSWCLLSELFGRIDRGRGMSELILVQTSRYARSLSRVLDPEPGADVTPDLDLDQNVHNYNVLVMTNNWLSRIHFFLFNLFKTNDLKECNCSLCKQKRHKYLCEQCVVLKMSW